MILIMLITYHILVTNVLVTEVLVNKDKYL